MPTDAIFSVKFNEINKFHKGFVEKDYSHNHD